MYEKIKTLADEALRVQNKLQMEQALRDISALCDAAMAPVTPEQVASESSAAMSAAKKAKK